MAVATRLTVDVQDQQIPPEAIRGPIPDTKVDHQIPVVYDQSTAAEVAAETRNLYTASADGNIKSVTWKIGVNPSTGDFTIEVKKAASASNTYTTILSAAESITSADADGANGTSALAVTTYSANDTFQVVIAATSPTDSRGVNVTILLDQDPS